MFIVGHDGWLPWRGSHPKQLVSLCVEALVGAQESPQGNNPSLVLQGEELRDRRETSDLGISCKVQPSTSPSWLG